jgi:hypothetical protein
MQRIWIFVGMAAAFAGSFLFAQSDADYQGWMKNIAATNQSLQKNITAKDGSAVSADAKKLEDAFKQVEGFWEKRSAPDAVNFAKQAQTAAAAVSKSAAGGNMDQAMADAKSMAANCGGCHMAHRERTDAGFKIK